MEQLAKDCGDDGLVSTSSSPRRRSIWGAYDLGSPKLSLGHRRGTLATLRRPFLHGIEHTHDLTRLSTGAASPVVDGTVGSDHPDRELCV